MKEKSLILGKTFLICFAGATLGSLFFIAVHSFFDIAGGLLYLVSGVAVAAFYLNFIKKEERNIGTHLVMDFSLVFGVLVSQFIDFMIVYAKQFSIPGGNQSALRKVYHTYFQTSYSNGIFINDGKVLIDSADGGISVWYAFIGYAIFAIIGLYIVFAGIKIGEACKKDPTAGKKKKGRMR